MLILKIYKWFSKDSTVNIIHSQTQRSLKVGLQNLKHHKPPGPSKSSTRKKTSKHGAYIISGIYPIHNRLSQVMDAAKL